jgi:hypothetical protein
MPRCIILSLKLENPLPKIAKIVHIAKLTPQSDN